ncbi:MAG TPA: hypothetical protein VN688_03575 [Gemmataceae bacterium]|nr:hypothetical protein [Gemmataceae bacterium]
MKRWIGGAIILTALMTQTGCGGQDRSPGALQAAFFDCLLDGDTQTAYTANTEGGIDALDLNTGAIRWSAAVQGKPLAVLDHRLVIQTPEPGRANAIRIVVLSTERVGERLRISDPVVFPSWVAVGVVHGRSFLSCGCIDKGALLLKWRARAWWDKGHPSREKERRAEKAADGVARIDLTSGSVEMVDQKKLPVAVAQQLNRELGKATDRQGHVLLRSAPQPLIVGNCVVTITEEIRPGQRALVLKRQKFGTKEELESIRLTQGVCFGWDVLPDGRSVLVHQPVDEKRLDADAKGWFVFSLETGKLLTRFPREDDTRAITVLGRKAFYVILGTHRKKAPGGSAWAQTLKVQDVKTGQLLWQCAIEDYRQADAPE